MFLCARIIFFLFFRFSISSAYFFPPSYTHFYNCIPSSLHSRNFCILFSSIFIIIVFFPYVCICLPPSLHSLIFCIFSCLPFIASPFASLIHAHVFICIITPSLHPCQTWESRPDKNDFYPLMFAPWHTHGRNIHASLTCTCCVWLPRTSTYRDILHSTFRKVCLACTNSRMCLNLHVRWCACSYWYTGRHTSASLCADRLKYYLILECVIDRY